jgi:hypothetical protein
MWIAFVAVVLSASLVPAAAEFDPEPFMRIAIG